MEVSNQLHAPQPLYPQYPLDRKLGRPQNWSGHRGKEKEIPSLPGVKHQSCSLVTKTYNLQNLQTIKNTQKWESQ